MSFAWPFFLTLLALPALLLVRKWRQSLSVTKRPSIIHARTGAMRIVEEPVDLPRDERRFWLMAALALSAVTLARPQWGRSPEQVFQQSREILFALDLSRSMLAQDVAPSRLERTKQSLATLLDELPGERVGLTVFAGTAFLQSPLSADHEILRELLPELGPAHLPEGGTNYRALLDTAIEAFGEDPHTDRILVIFSDGEITDGDWRPTIEALREKDVHVIGIAIGTTEGAQIPREGGGFVRDAHGGVVRSRLTTATLRDLAESTQGAFMEMGDADVTNRVKQAIDSAQKGDFLSPSKEVRRVERYQWTLVPALICLLLSLWREVPARPKARSLVWVARTEKTEGTRTGARRRSVAPQMAKTAAVIVLLLAGGIVVGEVQAQPVPPTDLSEMEDEPEPLPEKPLLDVVGRLAAAPNVTPKDWAMFAHSTADYGQLLTHSKMGVPTGLVEDALKAVALGEALDPKAANWAYLRVVLSRFTPPDSETAPPLPEFEKKKDKSKTDKSDKGGNEEKPDSEKKPNPTALGDMKKRSDKPPTDDKAERNEDPPALAPADFDPKIAAETLQELKKTDSPGRLFRLLEGGGSAVSKNSRDRDW